MSESDTTEQMLEILLEINKKLDQLLLQDKPNNYIDDSILDSMDVMTLLSLPDHLRTTARTLFDLDHATADDVANKTRKERAVESNYLNQLTRMGHINKYRQGRRVYFCINEKPEDYD